jgi:hypothetical protein
MPVLSPPEQCIWCKRRRPQVKFDESHVLPECVGNKDQQVLPDGVVCSSCNNYFGTQVEPKLLADPYFHVIAVTLSLVDPDDMNVFRNRIFDEQHPPKDRLKTHLSMHADVSKSDISLDIEYSISGVITRSYTPRDLAWLSRAVHKIGFEAFAWVHYVKGVDEPTDLFSPQFDHVRAWARRGQPQNQVRSVIRKMSNELKAEVDTRLWTFSDDFACEI